MLRSNQVLERRLTRLRLAGPELSHSRADNLSAMRRLSEADPYVTFGIKRVIEEVRKPEWDAEHCLRIASSITKCSQDVKYSEGRGYISPRSTLKGMRQAAQLLLEVCAGGGRIMLATGHPGAMIEFYVDLASLLRRLGAKIVDGASGQDLGHDNWVVDSVRGVGLVTDTCAAFHTHDIRPGEILLESLREPPDLVFADHGFAGAAINAGIPTIAVMDTNDPGLAIAKHLGLDVIIVPMNDNRPNCVTREAVAIMARLMAAPTRRGVLARTAGEISAARLEAELVGSRGRG